MSNGNIKTKLMKTPEEWTTLMDSVIKEIEDVGYPNKVHQTEIIRLLIHFVPARKHLNEALKIIIKGFKGIEKVSPDVEKWMKGCAKSPGAMT